MKDILIARRLLRIAREIAAGDSDKIEGTLEYKMDLAKKTVQSEDVLVKLARDDNADIRMLAVDHTHSTANVIEEAFKNTPKTCEPGDNDHLVLFAIAKNYKTPDTILSQLVDYTLKQNDNDWELRQKIAENENASKETLTKLIKGKYDDFMTGGDKYQYVSTAFSRIVGDHLDRESWYKGIETILKG